MFTTYILKSNNFIYFQIEHVKSALYSCTANFNLDPIKAGKCEHLALKNFETLLTLISQKNLGLRVRDSNY